jgi:hypothetical protein
LTTPETIQPIPVADSMRKIAALLEHGGTFPFRKIAALLREGVEAIETQPILVGRATVIGDSKLSNAIHMLHEDAHGGQFKMCSFEPCRSLPLDLMGPAPHSVDQA